MDVHVYIYLCMYTYDIYILYIYYVHYSNNLRLKEASPVSGERGQFESWKRCSENAKEKKMRDI